MAIALSLAGCLAAWHTEPSSSQGRRVLRASRLLWLAASLCLWFAWPHAPDFAAQPLWLWLQIGVVAALPLTLLELVTPPNACGPTRYLWVLCGIGCGISLLATMVHLLAMRASIGGVDFFFYVVNARDMIEVPGEVTSISYQYFPGVFQFWRCAFRLSDGDLAGLQWSYLVILVSNAVLIAAIIWSMSRRVELSVLGAVWYVVLLTRFEGLYGITEPIATLPLLIGLLAWQGKPLIPATGWWRASLLGVAIGIAVATKQQAGLLSVAASALLLQQWLPPKPRHQWRWLFALPIIATLTVLGITLLEGQGFEPLRVGLGMVSAYEPQGSFLQNTWKMVRNDESSALFAALAFAAWVSILVIPALRRLFIDSDWFAVTSFCVLAMLLSLVQLRTRGYYHYALLGAPFLVIACLLLTAKLVIPRLLAARVAAITWLEISCLLVFPLFYTGGNAQSLAVWRLDPAAFPTTKLWHESPEVTAALLKIGQEINGGERIFLFPPRHNVVHYLLGSRSANARGYGFLGEKIEAIDWSRAQHVVLVDENHQDPASRQLLAHIRRELVLANWKPTLQAGPFIVYTRLDDTLS